MNVPIITIQNASLAYDAHVIFSHLDLTLPSGKWISLIGTSGIGKSSLMRAIAGLLGREAHFRGQIQADNEISVSTQCAYMSQRDALLPWLNLLQNVLLPTKLSGGRNKTESTMMAFKLIDKAGLSDAIHLYPHQLSGGMRQRAALIRTLLSDKPIVLMDEPFSALDTITRYQLQNLAVQLLQNKTVFFITHDPNEALRLAHVIYLFSGTPARLEQVAQLSTHAPRDFNDPVLIAMQQKLFRRLLNNEKFLYAVG